MPPLRALALFAIGCTGQAGVPTPVTPVPSPVPTPVPVDHPADDVLSLAHAQVIGTHNSYHVETTPIDAWNYTHAPLDVQLVDQGVRQFELDLYWVDDGWSVLHVPVIDAGTTCARFVECLAALRAGSEVLGSHLPAVVLLEIKEPFGATGPDRLQALEQDLVEVLGDAHLLRPADIQGDSPTFADAMAGGWPPLLGQRGRFVMVVHDGGDWASTTRELELPSLFTDAFGDLTAPWAAVHSMNDPGDPRIAEVVAAGHLVRTRADSNVEEALANDGTTRDRALASGAQFVSTDFPAPHPDTGYVVRLPGEVAARCNPLGAPAACAPEALEDPALLGP